MYGETGMEWLRAKSHFIVASALLGLAMTLFLFLPLAVNLFGHAFNISEALTDPRTVDAFQTSFIAATVATLISMTFGVPLAYLLTQFEFPGRDLIDAMLDIPILIPHNAAGIALLAVLNPKVLSGASAYGISFLDSMLGVIAAMVFVSSTFMIRSAQDAFIAVSPDMDKVARSLGATPGKVFTMVYLPLASRGLLTGCLLTWARALSEYGAVVVLAYYPKTVPVHLMDVLVSEGLAVALPINALLILLAIGVLYTFRRLVTRRSVI